MKFVGGVHVGAVGVGGDGVHIGVHADVREREG
jgi:hypothetical protein